MALKQTCTSRIVLFVLKVTSFIIIILEVRKSAYSWFFWVYVALSDLLVWTNFFQISEKLNISRLSTASLGKFTEKLVRNLCKKHTWKYKFVSILKFMTEVFVMSDSKHWKKKTDPDIKVLIAFI